MLYWVLLMTASAYLLGSIPASYIAARLTRGMDIRNYGSGAVSGSNLWHSGIRWAIVPAGIFDILKGFVPVAVAGYTLHFPLWAQGLVGLAAIAGHNWSLYIRFAGGRGLATMMGVLGVIAPWELAIFIAFWLGGVVFLKNSPLGAISGAVVLPLSSLVLGEPAALTWCLVAVLLLLVMKRLFPDRPTASIAVWKKVAFYRLLLDRDIPDRESWIYRSRRYKEHSGEE